VPYTPVELRHVRLARELFGYNRRETQKVLEEVADSFEQVWRERGEFADKLEDLEAQLAQYRQREELLSATLIAAERSAADAKEAARREAELIIAEAHQEARYVARNAQRERERLAGEARRIESLLRSALDLIEEGSREAPRLLPNPARPPAVEAPKPTPELEAAAPAADADAPRPEAWPEPRPPAEQPDQPVSWRDRYDTREYAALVSQPDAEPEQPAQPEDAKPVEPAPAEPAPPEQPGEHVQLPPVDDESGEDVSPGREFDWGG
jgi:cell division initiation protein